MTHLLLLLCSLLTRLRAGVETLFPLLLTSAYYGLIFGERKFGSERFCFSLSVQAFPRLHTPSTLLPSDVGISSPANDAVGC